MTTAGTPALNKPLPDHSEAEARIEAALRVVNGIIEQINATDPHADDAPRFSMVTMGMAILQIKNILESGK